MSIGKKESNSYSIESEIRMSECQHLLLMLDFLQEESVSEDLEKAAIEAFKQIVDSDKNNFLEIFKAGAKWQKEQMIEKAIDAVVSQVPCSNEIILYNPSSVYKYSLPQEMNELGLNKGDKVKVIIIKNKY